MASGGVYSWEKFFVDGMREIEFSVINQLSNSNTNGKFIVPDYVKSVISLPLYGTNRTEEFIETKQLLGKILRTNEFVILNEFVPLFKEFVRNILSSNCDVERSANSIYQMHKFLLDHDLKKCFEHPTTWDSFLEFLRDDPDLGEMHLKDATNAFQTFQRGLQMISLELPKVDLVHCSLAWMPSFAAICEKKEYGCPIVVTEHGVAYREQLLNTNLFIDDAIAAKFWKRLAHNIIMTMYHEADAIVPVCASNAVWEVMMGADQSKIKVIYNGIDTRRFSPMKIETASNRPTIVVVARIDVWKDIVGLIRAVNIVREQVPDVLCQLYGQSIDLDYAIECADLVKELDLEDNFKFMGRTSEPEVAYNSGDMVVFSGITEGFPFSVIEAMACGKAVVASDVGGVGEALEGCGLLVRSRSPRDMADKIVELLRNKELREKLGKSALLRARSKFSIELSNSEYSNLYDSILSAKSPNQTAIAGILTAR